MPKHLLTARQVQTTQVDLAGAQIHPFPLGMKPSELDGPLSHFQATLFDRGDVAKLVHAINRAAGTQAVPADQLDRTLCVSWASLEQALSPIEARASGDDLSAQAGPAKATEAELELEKLQRQVGPRNLAWNAFVDAMKAATRVRLEILYVADDADSMSLA